jgi:hypothetical protein
MEYFEGVNHWEPLLCKEVVEGPYPKSSAASGTENQHAFVEKMEDTQQFY